MCVVLKQNRKNLKKASICLLYLHLHVVFIISVLLKLLALTVFAPGTLLIIVPRRVCYTPILAISRHWLLMERIGKVRRRLNKRIIRI